METIANILMITGTLGVAFYCFVLGRRLRRLNSLETGVGGAIATLSKQVQDLQATLDTARQGARSDADRLEELVAKAASTTQQLELMVASLHDIPPADKTQHDPLFTRHGRQKSHEDAI